MEPSTQVGRLPHVDEHVTRVATGVDDVWHSLAEALDGAFSRPVSSRYARLVGCVDHTASGPRPFVRGSTVPGFRATAVDPGRMLVLEGRHRFSSYALIFRVEPVEAGRSRLRAESRAAFPGLPGAVYRLLVVRTGAHARGVRSLLSTARRGAERPREG